MSEMKVEEFIYKEGQGRPWYFSTYAIYEAVKGAAAGLPISPIVFHKTIEGLTTITKALKEKTNAKIVVISRENADEVTTKLDGFVKDTLIFVDDGLDHLRKKLADAIRFLIDALTAQKDLLDAAKVRDKTVKVANSTYEFLLGFVKSAIDTVKTNYPETYERVTAIVGNAYNSVEGKATAILATAKVTTESLSDRSKDAITKVDEQITVTSAYILRTAHPYVHTAVQRGTPFVATAVEVSQPYVVQAKPFLDPWMARAQEVQLALQGHQVVGPYVARAYASAQRTMQEVKVYCFAEEPVEVEAAVQDLTSLSVLKAALAGAQSSLPSATATTALQKAEAVPVPQQTEIVSEQAAAVDPAGAGDKAAKRRGGAGGGGGAQGGGRGPKGGRSGGSVGAGAAEGVGESGSAREVGVAN